MSMQRDEHVMDDSEASEAELKERLDLVSCVLAAVVHTHGGTMSVSSEEIRKTPVSNLVIQGRLDDSGFDMYFIGDK